MAKTSRRGERGLVLAACAVALASAVSSPGNASAEQGRAIQQVEKYCTASWRNARLPQQEWDDCTQQALLELLELMPASELQAAIEQPESEARRELNRAIWRLVQRQRRQPKTVGLVESHVAAQSAGQVADEWQQVDSAARQCLSPRQQQVLSLIKSGWKVGEIAVALSTTTERVSDEKYKAISKLRQSLGNLA